MTQRPGLAAIALAVAAGAAQAQPANGWAFSLRSDHHADALALADFGDGAERRLDPRAGTNVAWIDDEVRASRRSGTLTWSVLARARATVVAGHDALQLVSQVANRRPVAADRSDAIDARWRSFTGGGLALARAWQPTEAWTLGAEVQALALRHWRERTISGRVDQFAADGSYAFALRSQALDDRLDFPFQQPFAARGHALLVGGTLAWRHEGWRVEASVRDAGWLRWRAVPQQEAVLDSRTAAVDADGYLNYQPLVQGQNGQQGRTRRAPVQARATLGWQAAPAVEVSGGAAWLQGVWLPRVGADVQSGRLRWGAAWHLHERRAALHAAWGGWRIEAGADRLDGRARSRVLALGWSTGL